MIVALTMHRGVTADYVGRREITLNCEVLPVEIAGWSQDQMEGRQISPFTGLELLQRNPCEALWSVEFSVRDGFPQALV